MLLQEFIEKKFRKNRELVYKIKKSLKKIGYNPEHWIRYPVYRKIKKELIGIDLKSFETLEISSGEYWKQNFSFKSYKNLNYPEFDICKKNKIKKKYDFIIADNVFEHLKYPYKAAKNIYKLLKPNGYFLIIVPFLVRVHNVQKECTRWN